MGLGSGQGTRPHTSQLKDPACATKTWCSQINIFKDFFCLKQKRTETGGEGKRLGSGSHAHPGASLPWGAPWCTIQATPCRPAALAQGQSGRALCDRVDCSPPGSLVWSTGFPNSSSNPSFATQSLWEFGGFLPGPPSHPHFTSEVTEYDRWTIKKAECQRIDAFQLWCWGRLLRVPWTARRSNQTEEPGGLQSTRSQRVGHDLATKQQQQCPNPGLCFPGPFTIQPCPSQP